MGWPEGVWARSEIGKEVAACLSLNELACISLEVLFKIKVLGLFFVSVFCTVAWYLLQM